MKFSANLGFLWSDLSLPEAIVAASKAGFDAVEFHWPYQQDRAHVLAALQQTDLPLMGLNTLRGGEGQNGLCALPGFQAEAEQVIDQAFDWAQLLGAKNVHVMAGFAEGYEAHNQFLTNLAYASAKGDQTGVGILIEPLNRFDAPGYFLKDQAQALSIVNELGKSNVKIMFDCYHVGRTEGDVIATYDKVKEQIGHVQFASIPDRQEPDQGLQPILQHIYESGWNAPMGAEYKPKKTIDEGLSWLAYYR